MKIDITITESFCEALAGQSTCFIAEKHVINGIMHHNKSVDGFVTIDGNVIPFSFSCMGVDGAIGTTNYIHRSIIKHLIPLYMYGKLKEE